MSEPLLQTDQSQRRAKNNGFLINFFISVYGLMGEKMLTQYKHKHGLLYGGMARRAPGRMHGRKECVKDEAKERKQVVLRILQYKTFLPEVCFCETVSCACLYKILVDF